MGVQEYTHTITTYITYYYLVLPGLPRYTYNYLLLFPFLPGPSFYSVP